MWFKKAPHTPPENTTPSSTAYFIAVINGQRYSTKTAEKIATRTASRTRNDPLYWAETLYKTANGAYFVAGNGHQDSPHLKAEGIKPLTEEEAMRWLEGGQFVEIIEKHFGDKVRDA